MSLFAHRFLTEDGGRSAAPGVYDDMLGLRVDSDGVPVVASSAMVGPTSTKAELDPSPTLGPTETRGDVDPDHHGAATWVLGPIETGSEVDADRQALP